MFIVDLNDNFFLNCSVLFSMDSDRICFAVMESYAFCQEAVVIVAQVNQLPDIRNHQSYVDLSQDDMAVSDVSFPPLYCRWCLSADFCILCSL